jgi:hypothetical protein
MPRYHNGYAVDNFSNDLSGAEAFEYHYNYLEPDDSSHSFEEVFNDDLEDFCCRDHDCPCGGI